MKKMCLTRIYKKKIMGQLFGVFAHVQFIQGSLNILLLLNVFGFENKNDFIIKFFFLMEGIFIQDLHIPSMYIQ